MTDDTAEGERLTELVRFFRDEENRVGPAKAGLLPTPTHLVQHQQLQIVGSSSATVAVP
jgi:hypothetical protein